MVKRPLESSKTNIKAAESKVINEKRGEKEREMERRKVLISPDFAPCDHLLIQRLVCVSKELEFGYFYLS